MEPSHAAHPAPGTASDLNLNNRHVATEAEVEVLLAELRDELVAQLRAGTRVRIA